MKAIVSSDIPKLVPPSENKNIRTGININSFPFNFDTTEAIPASSAPVFVVIPKNPPINKTNMAVVSDGELLSDLLAKRDVLKLRIASFQNTISIASNLCFRSRGDEIRQLSAVDVKALQKKVDALSRDYRILDNRIQAANWTADLIEE